jgi:hypothetical protein
MRRTKSGKSHHIYVCGTRHSYDLKDCVLVSINEAVLKGKILEEFQKTQM